jgi:hypothetical protein
MSTGFMAAEIGALGAAAELGGAVPLHAVFFERGFSRGDRWFVARVR